MCRSCLAEGENDSYLERAKESQQHFMLRKALHDLINAVNCLRTRIKPADLEKLSVLPKAGVDMAMARAIKLLREIEAPSEKRKV